MKYHARLEYEGKKHLWWNLSKDKLEAQLLVPFVNGHVVLVTRSGSKQLLNMKTVSLLTVYKTPVALERPKPGKNPVEFKARLFEANICTEEVLNEVRLAGSARTTQSLLQKAFKPPLPQIFVIMKFGDPELDSAYEGVIKPLAAEYGLKALRVDEIQNSGQITEQILDGIAESRLVLADLTGERPNCYYECGFAQALGKELILCVKSTDPVHFDLAGHRTIRWPTEAAFRRQLRVRLTSILVEPTV
jgi:hypothetical protein